MFTYQYGGKKGKKFKLQESRDTIVVRAQRRVPLLRLALTADGRRLVERMDRIAAFPAAGVEILRCARDVGRDEARAVLKKEKALEFAGRVLADTKSKNPVLYTENFFVKFEDGVRATEYKKLLRKHKLGIKRAIEYANNAFFVEAKSGTGQAVFEIADALLKSKATQLCHPELVREAAYRGAFPGQWHLKAMRIGGQSINQHSAVEAAWAMSEGAGIRIAVIDDGMDMNHEEFRSTDKIVAPRDATRGSDDPSPGSFDNHGTACAGVACADGLHGASGVAPKARLIPIRLQSGLGSQAEADAFMWAARNGADVISCSWGPRDGNWWDPNDPTHQQVVALPDSTRLAIDWAIQNGRNGRGCVITWAAGNGNESVDNDGYASYDKVIAVAACNDRGTRSAYSDFGEAIWCAFPSNDMVDALTPGIWTTDRMGSDGYNSGSTDGGDNAGHYTNSFGGTSSACPGAAGVAALVLARNSALRWDQVKDILKRSADDIDAAEGQYDRGGHSPFYGYGRLNAKRAVAMARPSGPKYMAVHTAIQDVPIRDLATSGLAIAVGDPRKAKAVRIAVDIEHTYVGDLVVRIVPPADQGAQPVVLHDRSGQGADNLKTVYDSVNAPGLGELASRPAAGQWTLEVSDHAQQDTGTLKQFSVQIDY
jgi:subtilisin family serine protease